MLAHGLHWHGLAFEHCSAYRPFKGGKAVASFVGAFAYLALLDRPGPAATIVTRWWRLLSKQHSAHPRTDQAGLDVADSAEKNSPTSCSALHDPLRVNS